ncbi:hypothetical protein K1719_000517 [Acacia pycnantha]|nr:hypothetical protein K1719_000517 [Acacia pycnantha]
MNEEEEEEVSVIYYIARNNGLLEHPHLMELPLSSSHTMLSLKDVINRFTFLRGQGMAHWLIPIHSLQKGT